ncbi:hypothetical protein ONE63_010888 [Megalurothrips usitatus]|uniref:3-hydroxyisobutyryl-CoA hydrolase, mitochondrial n=1 Tax=Megalurothrips usitatus TaxID=439358 RepID=A0AAV7XLT6_9NEOP|nr:hypothetical protein ONE63_010888 [Megalurothrips usitatus]
MCLTNLSFQNLCFKLSSVVCHGAKLVLKHRPPIALSSNMMQTRGLAADSEDVVLSQDVGDKGILILNRPKALNAVNLPMVQKCHETLLKWEKEKSLVICKGAGDKAFCAGGDVKTITTSRSDEYGKRLFRIEYMMNCIIATYTIPYIALIDGITMGGGIGLSVHGHYRVATEKTLCAMPETAIGLFPDVGGSYFLSRLKGYVGIYLALTGFRLKGADNLFVGLATHYCPSSDIPKLEKELLSCKNPKEVLERYKRCPEGAKYTLEPYLNKIDNIFSAPTVEEIYERLEKDTSDWARGTLLTLKKFCPLSLKITLKQIQLGSQLSIQECLQMEYRLACRSCDGYNFTEGVRALLVDKDQNPKWIPPTVEEVTQQMVDDFFAPLEPHEELKPRGGPKCSL